MIGRIVSTTFSGISEPLFSAMMPATMMTGGALALLCNLIARMPGFEGALPVNSVTALVGAPVIAAVLFGRRKDEMAE